MKKILLAIVFILFCFASCTPKNEKNLSENAVPETKNEPDAAAKTIMLLKEPLSLRAVRAGKMIKLEIIMAPSTTMKRKCLPWNLPLEKP